MFFLVPGQMFGWKMASPKKFLSVERRPETRNRADFSSTRYMFLFACDSCLETTWHEYMYIHTIIMYIYIYMYIIIVFMII